MDTYSLGRLGACNEAMVFAGRFRSLQAAWDACERGDWMLWLLGRLSGGAGDERRKALALCAADCAETALPLITDEETAAIALATLQTVRAWAHGETTIEEVTEAGRACYCAAYADADADAAAADAAYAAAAYAADAAAYAAAYAAAHAAADAASAYAAAHPAARTKALATCADIVRAHYPKAPVLP